MKKIILLMLTIALCAFTHEKKKVTIYMAGDSTMTIQALSKPVKDSISGITTNEPYPYRGWGQMLPTYFNDKIDIQNFAKSGKSTLTFVKDGLWKKIMDKVQSDDYVVIGFGHNDESKNRIERYTTPEQYEINIRNFIGDIRAKGAIPILCTPVARRKFDNGKLVDTHGIYSEIVRKIAKEEKILFVDMQKKTAKNILDYGEEGSTSLYIYLGAGINKNIPKGIKDDTHFSELGANLAAAAFVDGLRELKVRTLTKNLKR